jgi:hypothetical protein
MSVSPVRSDTGIFTDKFSGDSVVTILNVDQYDTIRFDFSQAVCTPTYIQIPVSMSSDDQVYALDFALKFNPSEITYASFVSYKPYLNVAANYNAADSTVRFSSFSFSQTIEPNTPLLAVRFNYGSLNQVNFSAFDSVETQLNGDYCSKLGISAGLNQPIGPGGTPVVTPGDSIQLSISLMAGQSSIWSNGASGPVTYVYNPGTYSVTITNAQGCSGSSFITLSSPSPLPVELISFYGISSDMAVKLHWTTATEYWNDRFIIERFHTSSGFEPIAVVAASGNTITQSEYMYTDQNPVIGTNVYRLIQIDKDGHSVYYDPIVVTHDAQVSQSAQLTVYPNPFNTSGGTVSLDPKGFTSGPMKLKLHNMAGQLVIESVIPSSSNLTFVLPELQKGVYVVSLQDSATYSSWSLLFIE